MKTQRKNQYTLVQIQEISFVDFNEQLAKINPDHLVVKVSNEIEINEKEIDLFLQTATKLKANNKSFVVIKKGINLEVIPDGLNIVPTLQEAEDLLEIEAIERQLGHVE